MLRVNKFSNCLTLSAESVSWVQCNPSPLPPLPANLHHPPIKQTTIYTRPVTILTLIRSSVTSKFCFQTSWFATYLPRWTSWNFRNISEILQHFSTCYQFSSLTMVQTEAWQVDFYQGKSGRTSWREFLSYTLLVNDALVDVARPTLILKSLLGSKGVFKFNHFVTYVGISFSRW